MPLAVIGLFLVAVPSILQSQQLTHRDALVMQRDSVNAVLAGTWEFQRDLAAAGSETVVARGRSLAARCRAADRVLETTRVTFQSTSQQARERRASAAFIDEIRRLQTVLRSECIRVFGDTAARGDSLRAWGPYRVSRVERAAARYAAAARDFGAVVGVKLEPVLPK